MDREPSPRIVAEKPAPVPAWRDGFALLVDPGDPDFAPPPPPPEDRSKLSTDELRRAGMSELSTSASTAMSALALAGERATAAAKGFRTAFANQRLAAARARSTNEDEEEQEEEDEEDGARERPTEARIVHACFREAMRPKLRGRSAKAAARDAILRALARWQKSSAPHHACFDAWREFALAAGHMKRRGEDAKRHEHALDAPADSRTDEETEGVYELVSGSCDLFAECARYEAVELCRRARLERFFAGQTLLNPGDPDDKVFIPIAGSVSAWIDADDEEEDEEEEEDDKVKGESKGSRRRRVAKTFVPGRSFGVPARAAAPPHRHAFVADVDAWCVTVSRGDCGGTEWEPFDVTVRKRVDFLCRVPGLFDATLVELEALALCAEERRYEPGLALVNQGQECRGAYFILSGTAAIIRRIRIDNRMEEERINREPDAPVPDHLRSALPDAAKANDRRRVVRARVGAAMSTRDGDGDRGDGSGDSPDSRGDGSGDSPDSRDSVVVDVQLRVAGSFGAVGGGDYFDRPAPCACFAVARGAKPVAALFIASKHLAKILSPKAMERFRRGCHPAPADDALRKSLAAKEASEAANRAAWTGQDGTAIEGVEPVGPDEELRRNPLAYSDSDSDDGDVDERRLDRPTLVPSARRSLRPFLRPRGARDSDAREWAKENGRLVVGWPFHRDVYDPRSDSHRVGPSFGGGFRVRANLNPNPKPDKARGVQRRSTSNDPDASKLAEIRDVGLVAAKSRVITRPKNPTERRGSYYRKFLDDVASFDPRATFAFDPSTTSPEWKSHEEWTAFATRPRMLTKLEFQNQRVVRDRRASDARVERTRDDANRRGGVKKTAAAVETDEDGGVIKRASFKDDDDDDDATATAAKRWLGYRDDARPDGVRVFRPSDRTAVLDADGASVLAFRAICYQTLRRLQKRLDGGESFKFGYDIGKRHDADEACSTARSAAGVGRCVDDWREGKGDAGGDVGSDGAAVPGRSTDLCVAVCRLTDASRTCTTTRDDLCALASKLCVESGVLSCVRWSGDSLLLFGDCDDPHVDDDEEIEYISRRALNAAIELRAFLVNYHAGKAKAQAGAPPPGGWNDDDGDDMEPQGDLAAGISIGSAFTLRRANSLHAVDGEVRDDAVRLCDLSSDDGGGVRCDAKMYPLCEDTHALVPAGPGGTGIEEAGRDGRRAASFAGYRVVGDPFRDLGPPPRAGETAPRRHTARVPASVPYFCRRVGSSEARAPKSRGRVGGAAGAAGRVLSEYLG